MIKAKKQFGQNFLQDSFFVSKIIESMPNLADKIVEIGPGLGDLTEELLKNRPVLAVEIDRELYSFLQKRFEREIASGRLEIVLADALELYRSGEFVDFDYDLVANLPYYIATPIILEALSDQRCKSVEVMIQKEVACKFAGIPELSSLAVVAKSVADVDLLFDVPPEAFNPAPKVDSSVIRFTKRGLCYDAEFAEFVKKLFVQPRKQLKKTLISFWQKKPVEEAYKKLSLDEKIRSHQLEIGQIFELYSLYKG